MKIITNNDLPFENGCVMAIGVFDGVHVGHASLLAKAKAESLAENVPLIVFTFAETPKNEYSKMLSTQSEKLSLLEKCGADGVYTADFAAYRDMTPEVFAESVLVGRFNAKSVVCGYDFMFGAGRRGNAETLKALLEKHGRTVTVFPPVTVGGEVVSSTLIRKYVADGDMEKASLLLGYDYSFTIPVENGRHIGRTLGFPTVNQRFPDGFPIPSFGVYACRCEIDGVVFNGVADVGVKPTVAENGDTVCETHVFGDVGELYGKKIKTTLLKKIRDEKKFASLSELGDAIAKDVEDVKEYFARG